MAHCAFWNSAAHSRKQQHAICNKLHNLFFFFLSLFLFYTWSILPGTFIASNYSNCQNKHGNCFNFILDIWVVESGLYIYLSISFSLCRRHKPGRGSSADVLADPHYDPAPSGHEALPAVSHGDPPSSAQHEPLPQLQHGESWCRHKQTHILRPFNSFSAISRGGSHKLHLLKWL